MVCGIFVFLYFYLKKNDLFFIFFSKISNNKIIPIDFDVVSAVYEYIYYYLYFGFPILVAHLVAYLFWGMASERISIRLRNRLYSTLIAQDLNFFESFSAEKTAALYT